MIGTGATLYIAAIMAGIALLVIWVLLPFALFGLKPLLRLIIRRQQEGQRTLTAILKLQEQQQAAAHATAKAEPR